MNTELEKDIEVTDSDDTLRQIFRAVRLHTKTTTIIVESKDGEIKVFEKPTRLIKNIKNVTPQEI